MSSTYTMTIRLGNPAYTWLHHKSIAGSGRSAKAGTIRGRDEDHPAGIPTLLGSDDGVPMETGYNVVVDLHCGSPTRLPC